MALLLDAVDRAGPTSDRDAVRDALSQTRDRVSILGTYAVTATGDTTLTRHGAYKVGPHGELVFAESLNELGLRRSPASGIGSRLVPAISALHYVGSFDATEHRR